MHVLEPGDRASIAGTETSASPSALVTGMIVAAEGAMNAASGDGDVLTTMRNGRGDLDGLVELLYGELRAAAHRQLRARPSDGTPTYSTTALVNEAYVRLRDRRAGWNDRDHFLSAAALAMRHILIDGARARASVKRGGERRRVTLGEEMMAVDDQADLLLVIDDALSALEAISARLAQVVMLRFYGGLSELETAETLGVTLKTVQRDWAKAKALLKEILER